MPRLRVADGAGVRVCHANPFVLPRGPLGPLVGRVMARGNAAQQREVLGFLGLRPGERVLEIGYGPGVLVALVVSQTQAAVVAGADPSPAMRRQAGRGAGRAAGAGREARVELRCGPAERLPFADAAFDVVVAVNNCQGWRDPRSGLREARRVMRPGGLLVVALHSPAAPGRLRASVLGVPDTLVRAARADVAAIFARVDRHDLVYSVAFTARRPHAAGPP